jgi:transcriptional regulator with XRE-family HTH domain
MSRTQKRHPRVTPISAGSNFANRHANKLRNQEFARRLNELMVQRKMSQSDLAKAAFGYIEDKHGVIQVAGRDRISSYTRGLQFPDNINLSRLAQALGVDEATLAPEMNKQAIVNSEPEFDIHQIPNSTRVLFTMQKEMELVLAAKILALLVAHSDQVTGQPIPKSNLTPKELKKIEQDFDDEEADWDEPYPEEDKFGLLADIRN